MRLMLPRLAMGLLILALAIPALAHNDLQPQTFQNLESALAQGLISPSDVALNKAYFAFEPERVDSRFFVASDYDRKYKDGTWVFQSILTDPNVDQDVKDYLQAQMDEPFGNGERDGDRVTFYSPMGWFQLSYLTVGPNAVPSADSNSNGTPDFVEWCADYLDHSWQTEIVDMGFIAPYVASGSAYYISFEDMPYYGYTTIQNAGLGQTRIVLHNDFFGFPNNDDPDGNQKGAAKVTCAHEFKHASQYKGSRWTEGGWVEVDATWAEEAVFPETNDYHNYIAYTGSPLYSPSYSLDYGGSGSYEDCIWQQYMSEVHGNQIIVDLWDWRVTNTGQSMLNSYRYWLQQYGSDLEDGFAEFIQFNNLTGYYSHPGYSYPDAPDLYSRRNWKNISGLTTAPQTTSCNHLAARFVRHASLSGLADYPKVTFSSTTSDQYRPHIVIDKLDGTISIFEMEVDGSGNGTLIVPVLFSAISELLIGFANADQVSNGNITYELGSDPSGGSDAPVIPGYGSMRLHPNYPNPFNPKTTLRFELASDSPVYLEVVSPSGRILRHLISGENYGAGDHEIVFDGKDDSGKELATGVYFTRIHLDGNETQVGKIQLIK